MAYAIEHAPVRVLKPYPRNARTHSKRQFEQIARSIERFGFTNPVLVDDDLMIIAGHGRVEAAKQLGLARVPTKGVHCNNVELGRFGRNRTNVWAYAGANAFGQHRDAEPSVMPRLLRLDLADNGP